MTAETGDGKQQEQTTTKATADFSTAMLTVRL
jgi:hypothetical protein